MLLLLTFVCKKEEQELHSSGEIRTFYREKLNKKLSATVLYNNNKTNAQDLCNNCACVSTVLSFLLWKNTAGDAA